jgi:hypothetical protein
VYSICRERIDQEKRAALELLNKPHPFLARCGMIRDVQRHIKMFALLDRVTSHTFSKRVKFLALREIHMQRLFTAHELILHLRDN